MEKKFIKVTPKGAEQSVIVPAANEAFYRSQNAKIETPTDEEIANARPEVRREKFAAQNQEKSKQAAKAEIEALKVENESLKAENASLKAKIQAMKKDDKSSKTGK